MLIVEKGKLYKVYNIYLLYIYPMKKIIDIDQKTVTKLKLLAAVEDQSVKALMEKAVSFFVAHKEKERLESFSIEEKEDLGLLLLMQQADQEAFANEADIMKVLDQ